MKAIFLAAGEGTRLRPLTDDLPKCMIPYKGKPLLGYGIDAMHAIGITDIVVVRGYLSDKIDFLDVRYIENREYSKTNMVETLFCAKAEFDEDLLISYADIVYRPQVAASLMSAPADIGVVIDKDWKSLWKLRMEDPLKDAETLKINSDGLITEIGKKPTSYYDIEGQYLGILKFSKNVLPTIIDFYENLDRDSEYDGKDFKNMFMTSFIQALIDAGFPVTAVPIHGGWIEIDSIQDLRVYESVQKNLI